MTEPSPKIPQHIAIIMDGNGRWAEQRGLPRLKGHEQGAESARAAIRACREAGVKYLTLYAFSVENWVRPESEVKGLMQLLQYNLKHYSRELLENSIQLKVIGKLDLLPESVRKALSKAEKLSSGGKQGTLILALSYGSRTEMADAARSMAQDVKAGTLQPEDIDEDLLSRHLYTEGIPDPDLMIRTSGEQRISNFLLWQLSYAELYFTPVLWPDFREPHLMEAVEEYGRRKRRFGGIEAQNRGELHAEK